jgi:hypothetical protein
MFLAQLFGNYSVNCPAGNIRMTDLSALAVPAGFVILASYSGIRRPAALLV